MKQLIYITSFILLLTPTLKPKTKIIPADFCSISDKQLELEIKKLRKKKRKQKKALKNTKKKLGNMKRLQRQRFKIAAKQAFLKIETKKGEKNETG